ncbi:MAG: hypothetical protein OEZ06_25635 [Myxococcales bacterium]|nr:hypothetical protein [Myxococcales bacterium]
MSAARRGILPLGLGALALLLWAPAAGVQAENALANETDSLVDGLFDDGGKKAGPAPRGSKKRARSGRGPAPAKNARDAADRDLVLGGDGAEKPKGERPLQPGILAPPEPVGVRKVAVVDGELPRDSSARMALLEELSAHTELEVIGSSDVDVVANRIGVGPDSSRGRKLLAAELGLFAWVELAPGPGGVRIRITDKHDVPRGSLDVSGRDDASLAATMHADFWPKLGPVLSEQARLEQRLYAQRELALERQKARADGLVRHRELAIKRREHEQQRLQDAKLAAIEKAKTRAEELERQRQLVVERRAEEARKRQEEEAEAQRKLAEMARQREAEQQRMAREAAMERERQAKQAAMARQQAAAKPAPAYGYGANANTGYGGQPNGYAPPQQAAWPAQAPAPAPAAGYGQQPSAGYGQPAYGSAPQGGGYGSAPPPQQGSSGKKAVNPAMLSPAARAWMEKRRAAGLAP